jgi:uncharacterized membrane protein
MMGSWGILIGLFWVGWSAGKGAHWAVVLVGSVPFAWGNLCLFVSVVMLAVLPILAALTHVRQVQLCT